MTISLLLCAFLGMVGGIANSLLIESGFVLPRIVLLEKERKMLSPGFLGNLMLGAIAALVVFLLGASDLPLLKQSGASIISGIGGGNLLTSIVQKYETTVLKTQIDSLEATVRSLSAGPPKGPQGGKS